MVFSCLNNGTQCTSIGSQNGSSQGVAFALYNPKNGPLFLRWHEYQYWINQYSDTMFDLFTRVE